MPADARKDFSAVNGQNLEVEVGMASGRGWGQLFALRHRRWAPAAPQRRVILARGPKIEENQTEMCGMSVYEVPNKVRKEAKLPPGLGQPKTLDDFLKAKRK